MNENNINIYDRFKGVLYGQAIGDALGLGTEGMTDEDMAWKYPTGIFCTISFNSIMFSGCCKKCNTLFFVKFPILQHILVIFIDIGYSQGFCWKLCCQWQESLQ